MTISIDLDPWEVLDQLSDKDLLRELARRRLEPERAVFAEVQELLLRGQVYAAQRAIERFLTPEFDAKAAYERARAGKHPFLIVRA